MSDAAAGLGLEAEDGEGDGTVTRVYLAALQNPEPTRSLLVAQGMKAHLIDHALEALQERGLIRMQPGGVIEVVPPDISLPTLALNYERSKSEMIVLQR